MVETCTILPIKAFTRAKTRLRPLLDESQCATVARLLAIGMLDALCSVPLIDRIVVVGQSRDQARLARSHGCDYLSDDPALDISRNLTRIARRQEISAARRLLYVPSDLASVSARDVSRLLETDRGGITICRAIRDGGTNALLASPPGRLRFSFGAGSAERHARAAAQERRRVRIVDEPAFRRDIDVPEDLAWLCRHGTAGPLLDYLRGSRLCARMLQRPPESLAS